MGRDARIEAMRIAWRDRLTLLGDPEHGKIPQEKLLSESYAAECAAQVLAAVKGGRVLEHELAPNPQGGMLNFCACDKQG